MSARAPSLALVLLPCLVLALLGLRAVQVEVDAAELRSRRSAEAAAARLGRSLNRLIAEHRDALPRPDTSVTTDVLEQLGTHLEPRWLLTDPARPELRLDTFDPLLAEIQSRVETLQAEGETELAAAWLGSTATTIDSPTDRAALLLQAVEIETDPSRRSVDAARLLTALAAVPSVAAEPVLTALQAIDAANWELPDGATFEPAALAWAYRRLAYDADSALRDQGASYLDRLEGGLGGELSLRDRVLRDVVGDSADGTGAWAVRSGVGALVVVGTRVVVEGAGEGTSVRVLGAIPPERLRERLADEAAELVAEGTVQSLRITAAGDVGLGEFGAASRNDTVRVTLTGALDGWTIDAVPAPSDGVPTLAWVLGLATIGTTAALVFGVLALRRTTLQQIRLAEDRRRFLDHVAHEVRTPATSLLALSDELVRGQVPDERRPAYDALLQSEARRLSDLVEETLDLSRLESGRLRFQQTQQDLVPLVAAAADGANDPHGVGVEVTSVEGAIPAQVDARAIVRTVRNLIENALSHSGTTTPVQVRVRETDHRIEIDVVDHGRGIAPAHRERVFERFYRVPSETHEGKGVGLGLVLCREVARAHGGDLTCESELGKGATFTLSLPAPPSEESR